MQWLLLHLIQSSVVFGVAVAAIVAVDFDAKVVAVAVAVPAVEFDEVAVAAVDFDVDAMAAVDFVVSVADAAVVVVVN